MLEHIPQLERLGWLNQILVFSDFTINHWDLTSRNWDPSKQ
jgi:hypothetical protein